MHLPQHGRIGVGLPANFVIFRGRRYSELLSRPQYDRVRAAVHCSTLPCCCLVLLAIEAAGCTVLVCCGYEPPAYQPPACLLTVPAAPAAPAVQVVVRDAVPLEEVPPAYEELDYVPAAIKTGGLLLPKEQPAQPWATCFMYL